MRLRVASVAVSLLAVVPALSHALGLGVIQLKSGLNAPLNAEIELIATPEELGSLKAQIASRDTFSRYGLDYPSFLTGIQLKVTRTADGRDVITLTSVSPMVEPFATLLVEASWARGRSLREYTVLFDPPVFAPDGAREAPVAAPVTGGGERSGVVARPSVPAPVAAPAPAPTAAPAEGSYVVRNGDSLSGITRSVYGEGSSDRAMIAVYRANPGAFSGNINVLRAGAVLRLPDEAAVAAVDPGEASSEVRRQSAAWSPGREFGGTSSDPPLAAALVIPDPRRTRRCRAGFPNSRRNLPSRAGCWSFAMRSWHACRVEPQPRHLLRRHRHLQRHPSRQSRLPLWPVNPSPNPKLPHPSRRRSRWSPPRRRNLPVRRCSIV
jgi:pilus assembly protein FimV